MQRVQESDLQMKMEALVQDLSTALEESSRTSSVRRRWGLRRRARSTGSLPAATNHKTQSDDSTSSVDPAFSRDRGMSSLHQSDSDDAGPTAGVHRQLTPFSLQARHVPLLHGNIESDSFNENFSPVHPSTRSDMVSSSSISSSESEAGVCTNDEGREGDDEQSDWFGGEHGHGWWEDDEGPPGAVGGADDDDGDEEDPTFKAILCGSFDHLSEEAKESYRAHVRFLRQGMNGCREIRGGRRRVRNERPGFSISTSANEKLSRFLQDPAQMELKLHPMKQQERDQLCQLAALYSLKMSTDPTLTCPVLTKTRNTMQAVRVEQVALSRFHTSSRHHQHHLSDFKKRRKMPQPMELVGAGASPIPDSNIGNTMLRNMGWEPGKGLGAHSSGITEPVPAAIRPKYQGLGHACTSS